MNGYVFSTGACFACGNVFSFNPRKVPSHRDEHGVRQPVCEHCVTTANIKREAKGLDPIVPLDGAYEPMPEEQL